LHLGQASHEHGVARRHAHLDLELGSTQASSRKGENSWQDAADKSAVAAGQAIIY
jgi:hypothetical protein